MDKRILIILLLLTQLCFPQKKDFEVYKGDTVNCRAQDGALHGRCILKYITQARDTVLSDGFYDNGKKTGIWKFYERNKLKAELNYLNGYVNGKVRLYYRNGCPAEEGLWNGASFLDEYIQYYTDSCGKILCKRDFGKKGKYVNDQEMNWPHHVETYDVKDYFFKNPVCCGCDSLPTDSSVLIFFNSKRVAEIIRYKSGWTKEYLFVKYPSSRNLFWRSHSLKNDTIKTYWLDSTLEIIMRFNLTKNKSFIASGQLYDDQKIFIYDKAGKLNSVTNFKTNSYNNTFFMDGLFTSYYPNGNKKEEGAYRVIKNPKPLPESGSKLTGAIKISSHIPESRKDGKWVLYYENGKVKIITNYKGGIIKSEKVLDE